MFETCRKWHVATRFAGVDTLDSDLVHYLALGPFRARKLAGRPIASIPTPPFTFRRACAQEGVPNKPRTKKSKHFFVNSEM
jgi:hypothetical protein